MNTTRFRTSVVVIIAVLIAIGNALVSAVATVMAIPGSGDPGAGFKIIAATFALGNIALFANALWSARAAGRRRQVIGIVLQLLTVPLCFAAALTIMALFGISDL